MKTNFKNKRAFTLIELLIVIAIIGILFIVLVSKVDFATDKAKATGVQTDFRSFQVALDTVAKENAGFNTFGYNTGDNAGAIPSGYAFESTEAENKTKGDGIRNSYDQGDKNLNGKQDVNGKDGYTGTTEVFTGRKIYTETWTEVYTLVKPGTTGLDIDAVFALESAINANLDPKLHITINAADGKITMANQARDPWKNEYHGVYISQAERDNGADRGAIIMYSNGANGKWGSAHDITNGVVSVTVPGNNVNGKDDYSIVSCYTFTNGYGEVLNMSTGFSNNQSFKGSNSPNGSPSVIPGVENGASGGNNVEDEEQVDIPAGLYVTGSNYTNSSKTWQELLTSGVIVVENGVLRTQFNGSGNPSAEVLVGDLMLPNDGSVTTIDTTAFALCQSLTNIYITDSVTTIGEAAFLYCGLQNVRLSNNISEIKQGTFIYSALQSVSIPANVTVIREQAFSNCYLLSSITLSKDIEIIESKSFDYCENLNSIVFKGTIEQWKNVEKQGGWKGYTGWENTAAPVSYIECSDGQYLIYKDGFDFYVNNNGTCMVSWDMSNYSSETVVIPNEFNGYVVTGIDWEVFYNHSSLKTITIPATVTYIGDSTFAHCTSLTNIVFLGTVEQWNNITLDNNWNLDVPATYVQCSDGQVNLQ